MMIARRQGYLTVVQEQQALELAAETGRLTRGLINSLASP
jgi:hypothetical protein